MCLIVDARVESLECKDRALYFLLNNFIGRAYLFLFPWSFGKVCGNFVLICIVVVSKDLLDNGFVVCLFHRDLAMAVEARLLVGETIVLVEDFNLTVDVFF